MMTAEAGVPLSHVDQGRSIAVIKGSVVVSMRQIPGGLVDTSTRVSALMPAVHGSPLHVGGPAATGVKDLARPDFGDPVEAEPCDAPVFWACGFTPQAALMVSHARDMDYRLA